MSTGHRSLHWRQSRVNVAKINDITACTASTLLAWSAIRYGSHSAGTNRGPCKGVVFLFWVTGKKTAAYAASNVNSLTVATTSTYRMNTIDFVIPRTYQLKTALSDSVKHTITYVYYDCT